MAGTGALADRKITAQTKVQTRGFLTLGKTRFYDWNHRGFGACNIYCGFGHSSDTFFFQMAGKLGIDRLGYWAKQYGFGEPTGIDLPGEVAGIVPTNEWKQDALGAQIFPGETYQAGIGQGYDVVTPIQLINAYAALANGGTLYQPQIVRDIVGPDGTVVRPFKPEGPPQDGRARRACSRRCATPRATPSLVRHTYNLVDLPIKVAGKSGTAEFGTRDSKGRLPFHSWFVGFVPKDPKNGSFDKHGLAARRPRLRLRLADEGQRRDRDREVLPAAPLRHQEGLPPAEPARARQLLPEQLMGVIRAEPARVTDWAAKPVGAAWRAFDLQLTTYAGLLVAIGLVMAYTNSVESGAVPLEAGTTFSRGLMWAAIAVDRLHPRNAFDYRWLKTLAWPIYGVQLGLLVLTLAIGERRRRVRPLGDDRAADVPVQRDRQGPDDHRPRGYLTTREDHLDSLSSILGACLLVGPPLVLVMLQPDLGTSLVFGGDPRRDALDVRREPALADRRWPSGVIAMVPVAWTYLLRDYQKERLTVVPRRQPGHPGRRLPALPGADRGRLGRTRRQGPDERHADAGRPPAGPGDRLRLRDACRGARVHRRRRALRAVRPAAVAGPRRRLAVARRVRDAVRGRRRIDDPVPARRQRRDGPRGHADHRASRCRS